MPSSYQKLLLISTSDSDYGKVGIESGRVNRSCLQPFQQEDVMTVSLTGQAHVESHRGRRRYSRMILGQFLEHFHRQVYGGVFDPDSPLSNERGFRTDVIAALRELRIPVVRWPGGWLWSIAIQKNIWRVRWSWKDGLSRENAGQQHWLAIVRMPSTM